MEAFVWNQCYVTGIEVVDEQHRRLVDIINRLGEAMLGGEPLSEGKLQVLFMELSSYAREHFRDEEALMRESGIDPGHIEMHVAHHHEFVEQLASMWRARGAMQNPAETVLGFLSAWLAFHILGEDQSMARQLARIKGGDAVAPAAVDQASRDNSTAALLDALRTLYHVLAEQNRDLAAANDRLMREMAAHHRST